MAEFTEIGWCNSTFNPWWGCTKVAPGCDHCYAHAFDKRVGGNHWEKDPIILSDQNWSKPLKWHRQDVKSGFRRKVFCGSMCDWTDNNAPQGQLERLWGVIEQTPLFHWQLLTKRAPRIQKCLPHDWGHGYDNVWLGVTVENIKHGLPRLERLKTIPAKVRWLSIEPLLEDLGDVDFTGIDWVIVGGESGHHARPMKKEWLINLREQCNEQRTPFFFKQWGGKIGKGGCDLEGIEIKQWPVAA